MWHKTKLCNLPLRRSFPKLQKRLRLFLMSSPVLNIIIYIISWNNKNSPQSRSRQSEHTNNAYRAGVIRRLGQRIIWKVHEMGWNMEWTVIGYDRTVAKPFLNYGLGWRGQATPVRHPNLTSSNLLSDCLHCGLNVPGTPKNADVS